jgi:hypothetical protein
MPPSSDPAGSTTVAVLLAILIYYGFAGTRVNALITRQVLDRTELVRHYGRIEVTGVIRLIVAGSLQLLFVLALCVSHAVDWHLLVPRVFQPLLLCYGVVLGIAEMSFGSFICNLAIHLSQLIYSARRSADRNLWFVAIEGGWMRGFLKTIDIVPMPFALGPIILYVAMEETVFRAVIINTVAPWGQVAAVSISTGFFVLVQAFHMPSWRSAMFPILGASVMGPVHGMLFIAVPDVLPLIVAHLTMFMIAIRWR